MSANHHHHEHHNHGHGHHHGHSHGKDFDSAAHFTKMAPTYNDLLNSKYKEVVVAVNKTLNELGPADGITWDKSSTRVLDYACGTGLVAKTVANRVKEVIGIDHAEGMVKVFNEEMQKDGYTNAQAHHGDLALTPLDAALEDPRLYGFNVAICSLAYHHIPDIKLVTERIAARLAPGGALVIFDRRPAKITDEQMNDKRIAHNGFEDEELKRLFGGAGLSEVEVRVCCEAVNTTDENGDDVEMPEVFMVIGRKAE